MGRFSRGDKKERPATLENNLRSVYVSVITTQRILVYGRIFLEDAANFYGKCCLYIQVQRPYQPVILEIGKILSRSTQLNA